MSMIVKVQNPHGEPCSGVKVCAWINGKGNSDVYTDTNGEAYFDYGPGYGEIYCDGSKIREGNLSARVLITCTSSGWLSSTYS